MNTLTEYGHQFFKWGEFPGLIASFRKQIQDWDPDPPHLLGISILLLATGELALAHGLGAENANLASFFRQWIGFLGFTLAAQFLVIRGGKITGSIFEKKGNSLTTFCFLNLSLLPFLIYLPMAVLLYESQLSGMETMRAVLFSLLSLKVFFNFKEAVEISHELNGWQSALVMGGGLGIIILAVVLLLYLSAISSFIGLISSLGLY